MSSISFDERFFSVDLYELFFCAETTKKRLSICLLWIVTFSYVYRIDLTWLYFIWASDEMSSTIDRSRDIVLSI